MAGELNLEVIEGPDAGKQIAVDRPIVIGRDPTADLVLDDGEVSGQHARITPSPDGSATVEDLESTNGTFVNQNELEGPAHLDAGDELLVGVSVLQLRTVDDFRSRGSGVIQLPPSLAIAPSASDVRQPGGRAASSRWRRSHPPRRRVIPPSISTSTCACAGAPSSPRWRSSC